MVETLATYQTNEPALFILGAGSKRKKGFRLTATTDGTWISIQGDRKEAEGFELHIATDGQYAEVMIESQETVKGTGGLELYTDRPA